MKANYTKPLLAVELFSLAQSSTRDCADTLPTENITSNDPYNCGWDYGFGFIFFIEGGKACTMNGEGASGYCYNFPSEDSFMFRS